MDTMKILLGATVALLLAAVVVSWQNMREQSANAAPDDLARVEAQIQQYKIEEQRLAAERELRALRAATPNLTAVPAPAPSTANTVAVPPGQAATAVPTAQPDRTADLEQRLRDAEEKAAKLERDKNVARDEAGVIAQRDLEKHDKELRRARLIKQALLIATVTEFVENPDIGSFAVIKVERPENVQPGTILDIRRNTGVLGKLKIGELNGEEAIANPIPASFMGGPVDIRPGDELILPPPF
jgi:hypothetical protein